MLVGGASNEPFVFEGIEAVNGGLIGDNLTSELDLSDEGGLPVFADVAMDEVEHRLLFLGEGAVRQTRLRHLRTNAIKTAQMLLFF